MVINPIIRIGAMAALLTGFSLLAVGAERKREPRPRPQPPSAQEVPDNLKRAPQWGPADAPWDGEPYYNKLPPELGVIGPLSAPTTLSATGEALQLDPGQPINFLTNGTELGTPTIIDCGTGASISGRDRAFVVKPGLNAEECIIKLGVQYAACPVVVSSADNGDVVATECRVGPLVVPPPEPPQPPENEPTYWDVNFRGFGVTFANAYLSMLQTGVTVAGGGAPIEGTRSNRWHNTGKHYFEAFHNSTVTGVQLGIGDQNVSVTDSRWGEGPSANAPISGLGAFALTSNNGFVTYDGNASAYVVPSCPAVSIWGVAVDLDAKLFWVRCVNVVGDVGLNVWNSGAGHNPNTGAGGYSFASINCPCFIYAGGRNNPTAKEVQGRFATSGMYALPSGFLRW